MHVLIAFLIVFGVLFAGALLTALCFQFCFNLVAEWQGWQPISFWVSFALMLTLNLIGRQLFSHSVSVKVEKDK